jgi:hypothetical protein
MMLNPWSAFPLVDISDAADVCPIRHTSIAAIHRDTEAYVLVAVFSGVAKVPSMIRWRLILRLPL